jgi:hypothetical protein
MTIEKLSYAEKINATSLLIEGIGKNQETFNTVGLNEAYLETLRTLKAQVEEADIVQETAKAALKTATVRLQRLLKQLSKQAGKGRKMVKYLIPQETWREYGVRDKR